MHDEEDPPAMPNHNLWLIGQAIHLRPVSRETRHTNSHESRGQDHHVTLRLNTLRLRDQASRENLVVDNLALECGH